MDSSDPMSWVGLLSDFVVFVDLDRVNLDDLMQARIGGIVRVDGNPRDAVLIHISPQDQFLGCVGGMISEDS